jgi:ribonuclease PH
LARPPSRNNRLLAKGKIIHQPLKKKVAAISVGIVGQEALLDLNYQEDVKAEVDSNIVMNEAGDFVEVQGSGEEAVFSQAQLDQLLALGKKGIAELCAIQQEAILSAEKPADPDALKNLAAMFGKK